MISKDENRKKEKKGYKKRIHCSDHVIYENKCLTFAFELSSQVKSNDHQIDKYQGHHYW